VRTPVVRDEPSFPRHGVCHDDDVRRVLTERGPDLDRVFAMISQDMRDPARDVVVEQPPPHG
jgi:hypothetical protein